MLSITAKARCLPQGASGVEPRQEIHNFVKVQDQFSLYIQALQRIYDQNQPDVASFFSMAGIHGLPYQQWDDTPSDTQDGYCTHGNVLFPVWHRPYMGLYEQALQTAAIGIAATYTVDQARFQQAALALRQPYWDWASNAVPPPEVISLDQVSIIAPNGQTIQVPNPLRRYTFHPIDPSFPDPYSSWKTTLRQPDSTGPDATDDIDVLTSTLKSVQRQLTSKTYNLLTRVHTWPAFSNHTPGDGGSSSNSLEAIHDGIHVDVGGNGQMSDPSVAAFDPIFFLHHANVDRLLSLWSALNPGVWVTPGEATGGTATIQADTLVDKSSNLTPFWKTQTTYWEPTQVTTTSALGYTYPEFNGLDLTNPSAVRTAIAKKVNQLYGGHDQANFSHVSTDHQSGGGYVLEWTARIQVKKYEVGGSFLVLLFLGSVPTDPKHWRTSPNFVGAHHVFANSVPDRCTNCRTHQDVETEGFVHLNEGIVEHSRLGSLEPDVVVPYLQRDLHWRIQKAGGHPVDLSNVPSLEVAVFATPMTFPPGSDFPVPGERHHHHEITGGRPGGYRGA
ncbi:tyrosinase [Mycena galopus ATCC 62051]|nr:tyrosinase [Mycena galopus ATCC 62051]